MLLGYLIMWALLLLVRLFDRLPDPVGRGFARLLNAATRPFDIVNYLGSWHGGALLGRHAMLTLFDRGMHYPTRWDPFLQDYMTLADIYRFPTQHFHRHQLTLAWTEN